MARCKLPVPCPAMSHLYGTLTLPFPKCLLVLRFPKASYYKVDCRHRAKHPPFLGAARPELLPTVLVRFAPGKTPSQGHFSSDGPRLLESEPTTTPNYGVQFDRAGKQHGRVANPLEKAALARMSLRGNRGAHLSCFSLHGANLHLHGHDRRSGPRPTSHSAPQSTCRKAAFPCSAQVSAGSHLLTDVNLAPEFPERHRIAPGIRVNSRIRLSQGWESAYTSA